MSPKFKLGDKVIVGYSHRGRVEQVHIYPDIGIHYTVYIPSLSATTYWSEGSLRLAKPLCEDMNHITTCEHCNPPISAIGDILNLVKEIAQANGTGVVRRRYIIGRSLAEEMALFKAMADMIGLSI